MPEKSSLAAIQREFERLAVELAKHDRPTPTSRRQRGLQRLTETVGVEGGRVLNDLVQFSPELARHIVDFAYGDVHSQDTLDVRTRALVVVAALAAMGTAQRQLETHIGTARNCGCTRDEIMATLLVITVYAGFPAAMNAMAAARSAFAAEPRGRRGRGAVSRAKIHRIK